MTYTATTQTPAPVVASDAQLPAAATAGLPAARRTRTWLAASIAAATSALQACGGGGGDSQTSHVSVSSSAANPSGGPAAAVSAPASTTVTGNVSTIPAAGNQVIAETNVAGGVTGPLTQSRTYVTPANDFDAARFLNQAQFSATEKEIATVRELGYAGWLAKQFDAAPGIGAWDWLTQKGYSDSAPNKHYQANYTDYAMWYQLIKSPDAVRRRVALALSEIFSVSTNGVGVSWPSFVMGAWWDLLCKNAFGNFRTLLEDVTLSPAMGQYLSIRGSKKENAAGRQPDENYAREIMQLMTIGLVELNPDGTPVLVDGQPVETYSQSDVSNLARVFSGYDFDMSANRGMLNGTTMLPDTSFSRRPMVLDQSQHSTYDVKFLTTSIPGGTPGNEKRKIALDALFNHKNVGPFIGRQLIQRLVTSNPSAAYVARVAAVFADNGKGMRGDMAATVAAVLLDDEARGPAGLQSKTFGKLREPMVRLVQWARTFDLVSGDDSWVIPNQSLPTLLGQSPLRSPSIFNFYRPGYKPPSTAIAAAGLVAPEFQLLNETTVSSYANFMQTVLRYGFWVTGRQYDIVASYTVEMSLATDAAAMVKRLNLVLAAGQLSDATVAMIVAALNATPVTATSSAANQLNRVAAAVLMVMVSPEYLVQK